MKQFDICLLSTSDIASDARCLNLARTLADAGKSIGIIAPNSKNISLEKIEIIDISVAPSQRAIDIWKHFSREAKSLLNDISAEIFCAMDIYALTASNRFVRKHKAKFYYDAREIYSAIGSLSGKWLKQKLQTWFELHHAKKIDKFLVSGPLDAKYLKKHFNTQNDFLVVMNLPPKRDAVSSDILREKYLIPNNKEILIYQGVLVGGRGIKKTIDALELLPEVVFCLMGWSPQEQEYKDYAAAKPYSDRIIFCGSVPYDELHAYTCSADIGMCFIEAISFSYELALPNKLFEYAMAGLPTLVSNLPAMADVVNKYQTGVLCEHDSTPKQLAESIEELINNKTSYQANCQKARSDFAYESQSEKIIKFFD
jgi:glycosyltransferase involved in cell wall biosynthesis